MRPGYSRNSYNRRTSPKVIGGHVQRKNNHVKTAELSCVIDRRSPYLGYQHVVSKRDIHDFIEIIPDWNKVSSGIKSIVLDSGGDNYDGCYTHCYHENTGVIWLSAWQKDLWVELNEFYFAEHSWLFKILGVVSEKRTEIVCDKEEVFWICYFTESQAKAFMLMHIFLHELGHHVDKLRSKSKRRVRSGEPFAEQYSIRRFHEIWPMYVKKFGMPC